MLRLREEVYDLERALEGGGGEGGDAVFRAILHGRKKAIRCYAGEGSS